MQQILACAQSVDVLMCGSTKQVHLEYPVYTYLFFLSFSISLSLTLSTLGWIVCSLACPLSLALSILFHTLVHVFQLKI